MKAKWILLLALAWLPNFPVLAQDRRDDTARPVERPAPAPARPQAASQPAFHINATSAAQPARIDLSHPTFRNNIGNPDPNRTTRWNAPANPQPQAQPQKSFQPSRSVGAVNNNRPARTVQRLSPSRFVSVQPTGSNVAHHHHPFTQGYVRKKIQKFGVSTLPNYITDRRNMLDADNLHSTIRFPQKGPDHQPLTAKVYGRRDLGNPMVTAQMAYINSGSLNDQLAQMNQTETQAGHYYWHAGDRFNYCHYVDSWGYHWYGWYAGESCFWTRYYADRWWFYDDNLDRWCFWDNGFWWWQDPFHVGDLYLYDYTNDQYIPADSSQDAVVSTVQAGNETVYRSPDGTRMVKVEVNGGDSFLMDTAIPPSFNPIYLASQVTNVQFSDTSDGTPLQVMLTLSDGSSDVFDDQGNPLNYSDDNAQDPQN
jgi:hypothetical protein